MFLAAIIGGLNRYHERHGVVIDSLRMSLPINLRTAGDDAGGNRFAPGALPGAGRSSKIRRNACEPSVRSCATGARSRRCG